MKVKVIETFDVTHTHNERISRDNNTHLTQDNNNNDNRKL